MIIPFPYFSPQVMTDQVYSDFGGWTGTSLSAQRQAAYLLGEMQISEYIQTYLKPTTVTGTYYYPQLYEAISMECGYIRSIDAVTIQSIDCMCKCSLKVSNGCAFVKDDTYGVIMIGAHDISECGCGVAPFKVQVAFTAGLSSGTAYQPNILLALRLASELILKEIVNEGALEGGAGDPGVQSWASISYTENRVRLGNSIFGNSAVANKIVKLLSTVKHYKALKLP